MNINEIIKTGVLVQLEIIKDEKILHYNTIIDSSVDEEGLFDINPPLKNNVYVRIPVGQKLNLSQMVNIDGKKEPVSFDAEVVEYSRPSELIGNTPIIRLKMLTEPKPTQRRNAFRLDVAIEGKFKVITKEEVSILNDVYTAHRQIELLGESKAKVVENLSILESAAKRILESDNNLTFKTKDISATGFRAVCDVKLQTGDDLLICITLENLSFKLPSVVLDCQPQEGDLKGYIMRVKFELSDNRTFDKLTKVLLGMQSKEIKLLIEKGLFDERLTLEPEAPNKGPKDFLSEYISSINLFSALSIIALYLYYLSASPRTVWGWETAMLDVPKVSYNWDLTTIEAARILALPIILINVVSIIFSIIRYRKYHKSHGERMQFIPFLVIIFAVILIFICNSYLIK